MKISEKIYRLRTDYNMTQLEFGKIAGVSDKAVSTWERGEKEPRMKPLQKLCAYFDIDINQFVDSETDIYNKGNPDSQEGNELRPEIIELAKRLARLTEDDLELIKAQAEVMEARRKKK